MAFDASQLPFGPVPILLVATSLYFYMRTLVKRAEITSSSFASPLFIAAFGWSIAFAPFATSRLVIAFVLPQILTALSFPLLLKLLMMRATSGRRNVFVFHKRSCKQNLQLISVLCAGVLICNAFVLNITPSECGTLKCKAAEIMLGDGEMYYSIIFTLNALSGIALSGLLSIAISAALPRKETKNSKSELCCFGTLLIITQDRSSNK